MADANKKGKSKSHKHNHHDHDHNHNDEEEKKQDSNHSHTHKHKHNHKNDHKHSSSCDHGHDHGHSHGHSHGKGCKHDHDEMNEMTFGTSLYQFIDKKHIKCLNESVSGAGKTVFKPYDERLDTSVFVESDIDGELLFTVYFTAEVQLRSIQLTMSDKDSAPTSLKLWNDKQDKIDFDNHSEYECSQSIELSFDKECKIHWKTKQHKFNDLTVLKMLFKNEDYDEDDEDVEEIKLIYIGLKGDYKGPKSRRAVHAIYEAAANPNDHAMIQKAKQQNSSKNDSLGGK